MKKLSGKIRFALVLATMVAIAVMVSAGVFAADITDIGSHWSKEYVEYGVNEGYINGYPDGTFKPDNPVTRAEFSKMINSALGITKTEDIIFFDVEEEQWYYNEICKAVYAGYVSGYDDGSFLPTHIITRQEAAVILSRIATEPEEFKSADSFADYDEVAGWAAESVAFSFSKGYFTGDELNRFLPASSLTRGQAAKILYTLKNNENIVNGDQVLVTGTVFCTNAIYTDDIVFEPTAEGALISLDGCKVMGSVKVKAAADSKLTAKGSKISVIEIDGSGATDVQIDDNTKVSYVLVESPVKLTGKNYGEVYMTGDDLVSGVSEIDGEVDTLSVSANVILKAGKTKNFKADTKSTIIIQSGTIESFQAYKSSAGSFITLADGVEVDTFTANAAVSIMGKGKIKHLDNKVSGVTYETKPDKISGYGAETEDAEPGYFKPSSVTPANGKTEVALNANITVNFAENIFDNDGDAVSSSYLDNCFELRKGSSSGTKLGYGASISSSQKITVNPESNFTAGTKYYLIVKEGVFTNRNGDKNERSVYYFTAKKAADNEITFDIESGDKNIALEKSFKITFSTAICEKGGDELTTSYLSDTAVELRKNSLSGTKVDISATINSTDKIITVNPDEDLEAGVKYYLVIPAGTLEYKDGTAISRTYVYFTTEDKLTVKVTPESGETGVLPDAEIVLEFNAPVKRPSGSNITTSYLANEVVELRKSSATGTKIGFSAAISSDRTKITITPDELVAGSKYYVIVLAEKLMDENENENEKVSSYFTVANAMVPSITPVNKSTDVDPAAPITIKFNEELYDKNGEKITAEYVEESAVVLKTSSSNGDKVAFEAQVSSDGKTITIVPERTLASYSKYYVAVTKNTLYNEEGKGNSAASSTFETSYTNAPDFLPGDGEEDVALNSNIEIVFEEKMYAIGGKELTTTYIKNNVVELYQGDEDGKPVSFTVSISTDKQTIVINPSSDLEGEALYTVIINAASLENENEVENLKYTSTFTTAEKISTVYTITPANKSKDISVSTAVLVEFESAVYRTNGNVASSAYIVNNAVELRKGSASGDKVSCTADISKDNKTIALIPEEKLEAGKTYYVKVVSGMLSYSDGTAVKSTTASFTTNDGTPTIEKFTLVNVGATYATFKVTSNIDATAYVYATDSKGARVEGSGVSVKAHEETEITLTGLASNHSYTAAVYLEGDSDTTSSAKTLGIKTVEPFEMEVSAVTENTATVKISAYCNGTLKLYYKLNKTGSEEITRVKGLSLKADAEREFKLTDLDSAAEYVVYAEFTDSADVTLSASEKFTTKEPKEEVLTLGEVTVIASNGDEYIVDIKDGKGSVTMESTTSVTIKAESSVENSVFTYNGGSEVKPGVKSAKITVTADKSNEIAGVLTSKDTGNKVEFTITVEVNE